VSEGSLLIFVPGFMQPGAAWGPVAERMPERYPSKCLDFATDTFEGRLTELAGAASGRPAALVGYSMGGRLALHAALSAPERFSVLVLVGASAGIDDRAARADRRRADEQLAAWIERAPIARVVERWERLPVFAGQAEQLVAEQRPGRLAHDPRRLARLLRSAGQGAMEPVWDELPALPLPVLAIAGARDERYVEAAERVAALTPHGRAESVPGASHAPQLERPAAVAALVEHFLDEHLAERLR